MNSKQLKRATMAEKQARLRAQIDDARALATIASPLPDYVGLEREALIEMGIAPMLDDVGCK